MESGAPSLAITSERVVRPGSMKATSFSSIVVFNVTRATLQAPVVSANATITGVRNCLGRRRGIVVA
jgi:hypothetical protein